MAPSLQGSERGRVQLARRTKDEQVPICRDQVSLQSTSRQSFCYTDPAEPGDAQRFGTEMIGVRTYMHHLWLNSFGGNIGRHMHMHMHVHMHMRMHVHVHVQACELELVHVSLNSLTLFFVGEGRWFLHVFWVVPFLSFPFIFLFIPKPFTKTAVIHVSTFSKTAVTSALDWINPRSTVCRFICSHKT